MKTFLVSGADGRMGRIITTMLLDSSAGIVVGVDPSFKVEGDTPNLHSHNFFITDKWDKVEPGDVVIDFSSPEGAINALQFACRCKSPIVIATTGLDELSERAIESGAKEIAVSHLPNYSMGVNVLRDLVKQAVKKLGSEWDVEVVEIHHGLKADAPSGTALKLAEDVMRIGGGQWLAHGREGRVGVRPPGEVGMHAVRGGDVVGEHQVMFFGPGERLIMEHRAHSRNNFAAGAIKMAMALIDKKPGLYTFDNI